LKACGLAAVRLPKAHVAFAFRDRGARGGIVLGERPLREAGRRCREQCIDLRELFVEHPWPACERAVVEPVGAPVSGRLYDLASELRPVLEPALDNDIDIRLDE